MILYRCLARNIANFATRAGRFIGPGSNCLLETGIHHGMIPAKEIDVRIDQTYILPPHKSLNGLEMAIVEVGLVGSNVGAAIKSGHVGRQHIFTAQLEVTSAGNRAESLHTRIASETADEHRRVEHVLHGLVGQATEEINGQIEGLIAALLDTLDSSPQSIGISPPPTFHSFANVSVNGFQAGCQGAFEWAIFINRAISSVRWLA